jgi:hypothetical protein
VPVDLSLNGDTANIDDQADMGHEDVKRRGGVVGQVFPDNSRSAWNPKVVRPQWERVDGAIGIGCQSGVWVYDVT